MKLAIADVNEAGLQQTAKEVAAIIGEPNVIAVPTDVSKFESVAEFRDKIYDKWGEVSVPCSYTGIMSALPPCHSVGYRGEDLRASPICAEPMPIHYKRKGDRLVDPSALRLLIRSTLLSLHHDHVH